MNRLGSQEAYDKYCKDTDIVWSALIERIPERKRTIQELEKIQSDFKTLNITYRVLVSEYQIDQLT